MRTPDSYGHKLYSGLDNRRVTDSKVRARVGRLQVYQPAPLLPVFASPGKRFVMYDFFEETLILSLARRSESALEVCMFSKTVQLLSLIPRRPKEAYERIRIIIDSRWEKSGPRIYNYELTAPAKALAELSGSLNDDLHARLQESELASIEESVRKAQELLPNDAPFRRSHSGDFLLARFCYLLTRVLCPTTVIETGVCYGVTSAFVLHALKVNGRGHLHSIDLPPLGADGDAFVGRFIPGKLRDRWVLHRGSSENQLSQLLKEVGPPGLFIHDSLHTYTNMRYEFALAWPALKSGGAVIADDIQGNMAFLELTAREDVAWSVVLQEDQKKSLFGVVVKSKPSL